MNNSNNWKSRRRDGNNSSNGGKASASGGKNLGYSGGRNRGSRSWRNRQNNQSFKGGERHFQKFVDTEHKNSEPNYWPQENWSSDNNRINDYHFNDQPASGGGIYNWIRNKPTNQLIIPQHINFDDQYEKDHQDLAPNNADPKQHREPELVQMEEQPLRDSNRDISVPKNDNNKEVAKQPSESHQSSASPVASNTSVKIEQEKYPINLKLKKNTTSSSSSSETSSSEDELKNNIEKKVSIKQEVNSNTKTPSLPLNIKLKTRKSSISSTQTKMSEKNKPLTETSSPSSSSAEEPSSPPPTPKAEKQTKQKTMKKSLLTKRKISSEDDVVCVGNLKNEIVLEDESDNSSTEAESTSETGANVLVELSKKTVKQTSEKCMICDKKGHTSFQCQMICKNCSAPYHGYRTCPHPANLNTMMQLFIEFCMQQLQNFQVENQSTASNVCDNVHKSKKVDSSNLTSAVNKTNKLKRKQVKANEINKKHKKSKKRKVSSSKKLKSKADRDESSDDDSETSSTATDEHISDSSAESVVSPKKKRKLKNINAYPHKSLSANSVGMPIVLSGLPNLTVPTASIQNSNSSTNALSTLLLTQMFQNAIGSLKK